MPRVLVEFPGDRCYGPVTVTMMQSNGCCGNGLDQFLLVWLPDGFQAFFGLQGWLRSSAGDGEGLVVVVVVADTEQDVTTIYMWWQSYRCFFSQYSFFHGRFGSALLCYTLTVRCTQNCKCSSSITVFCWRPHNSSSGACQRQSIYLYTTQDFTWRTNFFLWKENHCQLTTWWESVWYQGHGYLWAHSIVSWKRRVLTTEIYSPNSMCGEFKDKLIILFNIIILQHQ